MNIKRKRINEAKQFISAASKNLAEKFLFGSRISVLVPGNRFLEKDKPLAVQMGRDLILAWIQAMSTMIRFSHKEKRAFVREWQSCMWEGEEVVNPIPDNRKIFLPVWGVSKPSRKKLSKKAMDDLVADFGAKVY